MLFTVSFIGTAIACSSLHCNLTEDVCFPSINLSCQTLAKLQIRNTYVNNCCKEKVSIHVKCSITIHDIRTTCSLQTSHTLKLHHQWFSMGMQGCKFAPREHLAMFGDILIIPFGRVALAPKWVNIPQYTGQTPRKINN